MLYKAIEIRSFRGINKLSLNDLGDINILTGRNNVGKSAILEAISLLASGSSGFKNAFGDDFLQFLTFRRGSSPLAWDYLIKTGSKKSVITGHKVLGKETQTEGVVIGKEIDQLELGSDSSLYRTFEARMERQLTIDRERDYIRRGIRPRILHSSNHLYFYYRNGFEYLAGLFESPVGEKNDVVVTGRQTSQSKQETRDVLFMCNFEHLEGRLHDLAAEKGTLFNVIERLKEKIKTIVDLRRVGDALYVFYRGGKSMPLETMGDGFKANVLVSLSAHTLTEGVLVLEEPENFLHPGLMMHLIEELIIACKERKIQIFLSTHSEEFLRYLLERSDSLSVSTIRIFNSDDNVEAEVIPKEAALERISELGIDLRGF